MFTWSHTSKDLELSSSQISLVLTTLGITELVGALLAGYLCDRYSKGYVLGMFYFLRAIALFTLVLIPTASGALLFSGLFGLSYMATVVGTSMCTFEVFGEGNKGFAFGFIWLGHQLGAFLSTQLGANAFELFGSYHYTILGTGSIALVSGAISISFLTSQLLYKQS